MSNIITPNIGAIGSFNVSTPYNTIVNPLKEYKVESIRSIQEMVDAGENPLQTIYLDVNLTENDMKVDIKNKVKIVVLTDSANAYAYIPETKFLSAPDITGIRYQEKALAINIGLTLVEGELTTLMDDIKSLIQGRIGVISNVQEIDASAVMRIDKLTHNTLQQDRKTLINISPGYFYKYKACLEAKKALIEENKRLSCYVTSTLEETISERAALNRYAINVGSDLNMFKYRLASNLTLDNSLGVELTPNEYVIYNNDLNNKSICIVRLDSNSVIVVREVPISYNAHRHGIYVMNDMIVSIYLENSKVMYTVYDDELTILDSGDITGNVIYDNFILPMQIETNKLVLGYKSSNQSKAVIMFLDGNNLLVIDSIPIQGSDNNLIPNNRIFNIVKLNTVEGIILYNGYFMLASIIDDDFTIETIPNETYVDPRSTYIMNVSHNVATMCCPVVNILNVTEIDINHDRINAFKNTEFNYDNANTIVTLDRSLIFLENINADNSIKVKKYI